MTGARVTEVVVKHHPRIYGVSKYGFDRVLKVLSDLLAINMIIRFSSNPLKGFAICAMPFLLLTIFFGALGALALIFHWTSGKALFFLVSAALNGMAIVHLIVLGILGELVVGNSDLKHTQLPEVTKRPILLSKKERESEPVSDHKAITEVKSVNLGRRIGY
jgi:hypothetical protein